MSVLSNNHPFLFTVTNPNGLVHDAYGTLGMGTDTSIWINIDGAATWAQIATSRSGIVPLPLVTGLTGGGSTNLDGQTSSWLPLGTLLFITLSDGMEVFEVQTTTLTASQLPNIVVPLDSNQTTNPKAFVRVN